MKFQWRLPCVTYEYEKASSNIAADLTLASLIFRPAAGRVWGGAGGAARHRAADHRDHVHRHPQRRRLHPPPHHQEAVGDDPGSRIQTPPGLVI